MICDGAIEFKQHIDELCAKYGMSQKPLYNGCELFGSDWVDHCTWPHLRELYIGDVNTECNYWGTLHEIGHILHPEALHVFFNNKHYMYDRYGGSFNDLIDNEGFAWEWAMENSRFPLNKKIMDCIRHCMMGYWSAKQFMKQTGPIRSKLALAIRNW